MLSKSIAMTGYTYLNEEEKLDGLVYMYEHMMTSNEESRNKEIESIEAY